MLGCTMNKIIPIPKMIFIGVLSGAFVVGTTLPSFLAAEPMHEQHMVVLHPKNKHTNPVKDFAAGLLSFIPHSSLH